MAVTSSRLTCSRIGLHDLIISIGAAALTLTCGSGPDSASNLCSFSLPPGPFVVGAEGGSVDLSLTTQAGCTWNSDARPGEAHFSDENVVAWS